jgi:hydrogenase maturation protein HypF
MAATGLAAPVTTSAGRLFDAIAAIAGVRTHASYEGQAAGELEAACDPGERGAYAMPGLDARPAVLAAAGDAAAGAAPGTIAARFHAGLAAATVEAVEDAAGAAGTDLAVLAGGVFQNRRLLEAVAAGLTGRGLRVLAPVRLPPNDGAVAYGQAAVAIAAGA